MLPRRELTEVQRLRRENREARDQLVALRTEVRLKRPVQTVQTVQMQISNILKPSWTISDILHYVHRSSN